MGLLALSLASCCHFERCRTRCRAEKDDGKNPDPGGPGSLTRFRGFGILNSSGYPVDLQVLSVDNSWGGTLGIAHRDDQNPPAHQVPAFFPAMHYTLPGEMNQWATGGLLNNSSARFLQREPIASGAAVPLRYRPTSITFRYRVQDGSPVWKNVTIAIQHGCVGPACVDAWYFKSANVVLKPSAPNVFTIEWMMAGGMHLSQWSYRNPPMAPPPASVDADCGNPPALCAGILGRISIVQ